jgi:hypothetical protein
MLDSLYKTGYQQASSDLKEILKQMIVHWAASGGQIDALEWAQDPGMHGNAESCMWAAFNGPLHVLQLTEITQPCVHVCNGLFICQLYLLPDLLEETDCKEDTPLTLPFCILCFPLTVDNSDMS